MKKKCLLGFLSCILFKANWKILFKAKWIILAEETSDRPRSSLPTEIQMLRLPQPRRTHLCLITPLHLEQGLEPSLVTHVSERSAKAKDLL